MRGAWKQFQHDGSGGENRWIQEQGTNHPLVDANPDYKRTMAQHENFLRNNPPRVQKRKCRRVAAARFAIRRLPRWERIASRLPIYRTEGILGLALPVNLVAVDTPLEGQSRRRAMRTRACRPGSIASPLPLQQSRRWIDGR